MKTKNKYRKWARLDNSKTKEIIKCFSLDLTATKTAELLNLNTKTIDDWYGYFRKAIYFHCVAEKQEKVGGIIELDEEGELWGTLKGNAVSLINTDSLRKYSDMKYLNGFIKYQNILHSYGVTSIGLIEEKRMSLEVYRRLEITNKR